MVNFPNIQLINFQNLKNSEILGITEMPGYLGNFQNINFNFAKSSYIIKMFAKNNKYTFLKSQ